MFRLTFYSNWRIFFWFFMVLKAKLFLLDHKKWNVQIFGKIDEHQRDPELFFQRIKNRIEVILHFKDENLPLSTLHDIIKRFKSGIRLNTYWMPEDHPKYLLDNYLKENRQTGNKQTWVVYQRKLFEKFGVSRSSVRQILKKIGVKYFKRQQAPLFLEKLLVEIHRKYRKLESFWREKHEFINSNMPGNNGFICIGQKKGSR